MFIAEDGTGLVDANSFATVAFADSYFLDRGITAWTGIAAVKEAALIKATDYIETRFIARFKGDALTAEQALCFPRDAAGVLPAALRKATAEYAVRALAAVLAPDPVTDTSGLQVTSTLEKLGPLETKTDYAQVSASAFKAYPAADALLKPLLKTSGVVR